VASSRGVGRQPARAGGDDYASLALGVVFPEVADRQPTLFDIAIELLRRGAEPGTVRRRTLQCLRISILHGMIPWARLRLAHKMVDLIRVVQHDPVAE
jgi:hypothetical protein